jgi:hypothetical protein
MYPITYTIVKLPRVVAYVKNFCYFLGFTLLLTSFEKYVILFTEIKYILAIYKF